MTALLLKLFNMSISASWLVLAVLLLRLVLKKAPKWMDVLLWGMVAVRLICPFSIESALSLIPSAETIPEKVMSGPNFDVQTGIAPVDERINEYLDTRYFEGITVPANNGAHIMTVLAALWAAGVVLLIGYTIISYGRLRYKVREAVLFRDNIYQSEHVASPFVLGVFRPKIYLPFKLDGQNLEHVIAHEGAHIRRRDHWWKPLGFLLLTVYWFNPLVWVAYVLLCRDIELACDEKVIRELGSAQRADYTQALVACSVSNYRIAACPLAFGEVGVKERVKSVMNYKKPAFWIILLAAAACAAVAVCFLTNPLSRNTVLMGADYNVEKVLYAVTIGDEVSTSPPLQYCVSADLHLYAKQTEGGPWDYLGALSPYPLTKDELYAYMPVDVLRKDVKVRQITDAYILRVENENFYLVFQTKDGKTYLAYGWEDISERGEYGSDDTSLRRLYRLESTFRPGSFVANFFDRSLTRAAGGSVYTFANFENDRIPGYSVVGFRAGDCGVPDEMTNLGFAVFQTTGTGCRLIDCRTYKDAALAENGIYCCEDPAVADANGEIRDDNTFDVVLILNENVDRVERVYSAGGKEDWVQADAHITSPYMSLWPWSNNQGHTAVAQYFYDKAGNRIAADSAIPLRSASWTGLPDPSGGAAVKWFDFFELLEGLNRGDSLEIELPEFPGVTFRWYSGRMEAVTGDGITTLYSGMPIWSAYFCDLTGDGMPEICSTLSFGSGMIDDRIIIYDYAGGASYELSDRGHYDYSLRQNSGDGRLYVDQKTYPGGELVDTGPLVFRDGCIQVGFDGARQEPFTDPDTVYPAAIAAYRAFLSGSRAQLAEGQAETWWIPEFQGDGLEYKYTYLDLDGDGSVELVVQGDSPVIYNGVFHFEGGQIFCWNSDAVEMSCWDAPLRDGTMVREYDTGRNSSYTVFRYTSGGEQVELHRLFAREELIPEDSTEPCPYYEIDGAEVTEEEFNEGLKELVLDKTLDIGAWTGA